jgi:sirohydrochlorin cobaltochelatase
VQDHARALDRRGALAPVGVCALYGAPRLEAWLDQLGEEAVRLVPFMMAEGYTFDRLRERVAAHPNGTRIQVARPVGVHPGLSGLIARRAHGACLEAGWDPAETALLLVGHGTTRHAASTRTAKAHARRLARDGGFAEVATAYLDDDPGVADAVSRLRAPACVSVGFFTDAGDHGRDDVPELLAQTARPTRYAGPIGPQAPMRRIILDLMRGDPPD